MKVRKRSESKDVRLILTGMIVDRTVLGKVAAKWEDNLFLTKWANLIAEWCIDFFEKYEKPPLDAIENLFEEWAEKAKDTETIDLIEKFLGELSEQYASTAEEINAEYIIDLASNHFNKIKLRNLADGIKDDLDRGRGTAAHEKLSKFHRVELGGQIGTDVLQDDEAIRSALNSKEDVVIRYTGDLGEFFGDALCRDGLIAFEGIEKRGKSFWLLDMAWRAMEQRRKVAFFEAGDLSQNQIMRRFITRAAKRPVSTKQFKVPVKMVRRKSVKKSLDVRVKVKYEKKKFTTVLDWPEARRSCDKVMKGVRSKKSYLKLFCYPNSTLTISQVKSTLQDWAMEGWIADVVCIDYADILAPEYRTKEVRESINEVWKHLRQVTQSYHCLVLTATQSSAAAYKVRSIGMSHFSEDKRKRAHTTGNIALNQTKDEKDADVMRLGWITNRERHFPREVHVAGCRGIANPAICSLFVDENYFEK